MLGVRSLGCSLADVLWTRSDCTPKSLKSRPPNGDIVKAINLGADGYLLKPTDKNELVARTKGMLRRSWELRNPMP
jgi:DNA-binding response OmpR family regulator